MKWEGVLIGIPRSPYLLLLLRLEILDKASVGLGDNVGVAMHIKPDFMSEDLTGFSRSNVDSMSELEVRLEVGGYGRVGYGSRLFPVGVGSGFCCC